MAGDPWPRRQITAVGASPRPKSVRNSKLSLLQNSEAEEAGINPAPTKKHVGEGFIPSLPNRCFIVETP